MTSRALPLLLALLLPAALRAEAPPPAVALPATPAGPLDRGAQIELDLLNQTLAFVHDQPTFYLRRGEVRLKNKDYPGAEADFGQAIQLEPEEPLGDARRGYAREMLGWDQLALADTENALELKPNDRELLAQRARNLVDVGRYRDAAVTLTALFATQEQDAYALNTRALARIGLGDYYGAISDCDASIAREAGYSWAFEIRGLAKYHLGLLKGARSDYDQMLARCGDAARNKASGLLHRALFLALLGDIPAALADCENAVVQSPARIEPAALFHRTILRQQAGLPADDLLAHALEQWTDEEDVAVGRFLLGQLPEEELLRAAAQADPLRHPDFSHVASYYAGMINLLQGRETRGAALLQPCAVLSPLGYESLLAAAELKRREKK